MNETSADNAQHGDYLYTVCVEVNPYNDEFDFYLVMKSNYDTAFCRPLTRQNRILLAYTEDVEELLSLCDQDIEGLTLTSTEKIQCSISDLLSAVENKVTPELNSLSMTLNFILDSIVIYNFDDINYMKEISNLADHATFYLNTEAFFDSESHRKEVVSAVYWAWGVLFANAWIIDR